MIGHGKTVAAMHLATRVLNSRIDEINKQNDAVCPCSDHPFKLISTKVVSIRHAWDFIALLGPNSIPCFTADDIACNEVSAIGSVYGSHKYIRSMLAMRLLGYDPEQLTPDSPYYILARYSPFIPGRSILCKVSHAHGRQHMCKNEIIADFKHIETVRRMCAEQYMDKLDPMRMSLPTKLRTICENEIVANFDDYVMADTIKLDPVRLAAVIRMCARMVQDILVQGRIDKGSAFAPVCKDVLKIIHSLVFAGYTPTEERDAGKG